MNDQNIESHMHIWCEWMNSFAEVYVKCWRVRYWMDEGYVDERIM
jgi:hypothetical protein